jgi:hypothetical protein
MHLAPKVIRYAGARYVLQAATTIDPLGQRLYEHLENHGSEDDFGDLRGHYYLLSFPEGMDVEGEPSFAAAILEEKVDDVQYDTFPSVEAAADDWESLKESYRLHLEHHPVTT